MRERSRHSEASGLLSRGTRLHSRLKVSLGQCGRESHALLQSWLSGLLQGNPMYPHTLQLYKLECGHLQPGTPRDSAAIKKSETVTLQGSQGRGPVSVFDSRVMGQGTVITVSPSATATVGSSALCLINSPWGSRVGKTEGNSSQPSPSQSPLPDNVSILWLL